MDYRTLCLDLSMAKTAVLNAAHLAIKDFITQNNGVLELGYIRLASNRVVDDNSYLILNNGKIECRNYDDTINVLFDTSLDAALAVLSNITHD